MWLLLCWVVESQVPLTGTIRPLTSVPADTNGLSATDRTTGLAVSQLNSTRPSFTKSDYNSLFTVNSLSTLAYTIPVTLDSTTSTYQFDSNLFYQNTLFSFELATDLNVGQLTGKTLLFNSAGDLWVYFGYQNGNTRIGGTLAVDYGGHHNKLADFSLVWNNFASNLPGITAASVVRMYVFYAHRRTNIPPALKISVTAQAACNAESVGVLVPNLNLSALDTAAGAGKSVTQVMNGETALVLLSDSSLGGSYEAAFAWYPKFQRITSGFVTQFDYLLQGRANGFAFVFQNNNRQTSAVGGGGSNLGYGGQSFTNQAAVEFDVFPDSTDAGANRIELHTKYNLENSASTTSEVTVISTPNTGVLNVTGWTAVTITYGPPGGSGTVGSLSVWINNTLWYTANISHTRVLSDIGEDVLFGFTTSNGPSAFPNNVFIKNWRLWTTPLSGLQSTFTTSAGWNTPRANDGDSSADLIVTTKDPCGRLISLNGLGTTAFIVDTNMSPTGVSSYSFAGNGSYNIFYYNTVTGTYSLAISFDGQQIAGSPFSITVVADIVSQYSTFNATSGIVAGKVEAADTVTLVITARDRFSNLNYETPSYPFLANWASENSVTATVINPPYYTAQLITTIGSEPLSRGIFVTYNGNPLASTLSAVVVATDVDGDKTQFDLPGGQFQSIVAGVRARVTITPYDRYRNRIFNNPGGTIAFLMSLPGVFVRANEDPIPWTTNLTYATFPHWEFTFDPQIAGRYSESFLYDAIRLNAGVSPVVVAGPVAGGDLSFVPQTVVSSLQSGFTVLTQDKFGNLRTDPSDKSLIVSLNNLNTTCGINPTNINSSAILGFGCSYQGSFSGRYGVLFTPTTQQNLTIAVYLDGKLLNISSIISVVSGPPDPSKSSIESATTPLIAGRTGYLVVALKDIQNNAVYGRSADIRSSLLLVQMSGSGASSATLLINSTTEPTPGTYSIPFSATAIGTITFNASISGNAQNIGRSGMYSTSILAAAPDPSRFLVSGNGLATQQVFSSNGTVDIALRDTYGNPITALNTLVNFSVTTIPATSPSITYRAGQPFDHRVVFTNPAPTPSAVPFKVNIKFNNVTIRSGNLSITGVNDASTNATCLLRTVNTSVAGTQLFVVIVDKGAYSQYATPPVFSAEFDMNGIKTAAQTVTPPSDPSSNLWRAVFQSAPTLVGSYSLFIYSNGQPSSACNPCLQCNLTVVPGNPAVGYTKMEALSYTGTVGMAFDVNITVYDQYGNLISSPSNITLSSSTTSTFNSTTLVAPGVLQTRATTFVATPWELKAYFGSALIVSHVFVSLAGPPKSARIIDFASNGTIQGIAGLPYGPSSGFRGYCLVVQDQYNQTITKPELNNAFEMTLKPVSGSYNVSLISTLTTAFDGSSCYQLLFTPTMINSGFTPFDITYNGALLVTHTNAIFLPGNVDVSKVRVSNLKSQYVASEAFQFSVVLVDSYNNNITTASEQLYGAVASLPSRGRIIGPITGSFSSPSWGFTYPGTTNSLGELTYAGIWTIALSYRGATLNLGPSNGFPTNITVVPGPTLAANTVIMLPVIRTGPMNGSVGLVAGVTGNWSFILYDRYLNPVNNVNNDDVNVTFVSGVRDFTICSKQDSTSPDFNQSLYNTSSGILATYDVATGQGTMFSTVARSVVMFLQVNKMFVYVGSCTNTQQTFVVSPGQEDPANTLISGTGLRGGVAGSFLSFTIALRDTYNNAIDRGGALVEFKRTAASPCLVNYPNVLTVTNQSLVVDHDNGTYTSTFQTTQSQEFLLLVSIDGRLAGNISECKIVTVSPWYADSGFHDAQDLPLRVRAGSLATIRVSAEDIYDNVVYNQAIYANHQFTASIDRSLCPMYVKKTTNANNASATNAGAPWIGWDSTTSGCVSGAGDIRIVAGQALRAAISNGGCFDTCDAICQNLNSSATSNLVLFAAGYQQKIGNGAKACSIFLDSSVSSYDLNYRVSSSTANCVVPPCWSDKSVLQTSQSTFFVPEYPGQYAGVFLLVADPNCSACVPSSRTTPIVFQVDPASCSQEVNASVPYRCADGSCKVSRDFCIENCPANTPYKCPGGCSATACVCPANYTMCAVTSHCVSSAALCPASDSNAAICPTGSTSCWNSLASRRVCPSTFIMCSDSQTCVRNASECPKQTPCMDGMFQCQNGYCVNEGESCPSTPSCGNGVICPDGSCATSAAACSDVASCFEPISFRCADGSCRASMADCPTSVTCPLGFILCENRLCMKTCTAAVVGCSNGEIRCPDGSCRNNEGLCATGTTCTAAKPVLCPDGSCVASLRSCAMLPDCNATRCSSGFCVTNSSFCPTLVTCPFNAPVRCPDGQCVNNSSKCVTQPACPYVTCPDGSCRREFVDCPSISACPSDSPIRCADGSCQTGAYSCPVPSCGALYRCPGGPCMETKSQCPTRTTCPPNYIRCVDGSCRSSCDSVTVAKCASGLIACPQGAYGLTCATDISRCPFAPTCPSDRPVRCLDATCVFAAKDCIATSSIAAEKTACPDGGWASNGAENCYPGVTCPPWNPVKCWDNTCRQLADDCPKQGPCPISLGGRYLCSDGTCARTLDLCASRGTRCADGLIKCPTGTCVSNPALCPNSTTVSCPDQATMCMDGSCRRTPSIWCRPLLCPVHVPYLCDNGACALEAARCPLANDCPYNLPHRCASNGSCVSDKTTCPALVCANNTFLCADGSGCSADCGCTVGEAGCTAPQANGCKNPGEIRCHDGICKPSYYCTGRAPAITTDIDITPGFAGSNMCPMSRPFRCSNGLCAISSTRCPVYPIPAVAPCSKSTPFLCANGMCVMSGSQCPVLVDCPRQNGIKRCANGYCDTKCSSINTCPKTQNYRCSNGMCVASAELCVDNTNNNCPTNQTICSDGHCRTNGTSCPDPASANGCATGLLKCYDGSCKATCPKTRRCPITHAYICSGDCSTTPCAGGTMSVSGCEVENPFRCADGTCKKYPARLGNQTADRCAPTLLCDGLRPVLCGDGTCVALAKHCRPIVCNTKLCPDGTCSETCPVLSACPAGQPVLCPDGACRTSVARCSGRATCDLPTPHKCWDGTCLASLLDCVLATSKLVAPSFTSTDLVTSVCSTGIVCPNGLCALTAEDCEIVPACPYEAPLRCSNGGCYSNSSQCPTMASCTDKTSKRCEDGTCRKTCLEYNGCGLAKPYFCPGRPILCVSDQTACNVQPIVACSSNCNRDVAASKQSVTINSNYDTTIEVGLQHNLPRLRVTFYSGAFEDSAALVDIVPARISDVVLSDRVLSTPFKIQSKSKLTTSLGVDADIDWKRFESSVSVTNAAASISCELQASYEITTSYVDASGAKGTCTGEANITTGSVGIRLDPSGASCPASEELLTFTNQTIFTTFSEASQASTSCLCTTTQNKTSKCFRAVRNRAQVTLSTYAVSQPKCPEDYEVAAGTGVISYNLNPVQNSADACYLIVRAAFFADHDICLGVLSGDRFRCLETRADRVERDWNSPFDQPGIRRIGRVRTLNQVYAFVFNPLPPDEVVFVPAVTWWELYGTATLASSISFGVVFCCAAIILFNFNRFRQKYQLEKEHMDHLQDQVADLDQYAGGLGMTDEGGEFDMVANPMVIEIEALQKQVETVNDHLHGQAEEDAAEIDALELERQQLFAEIQRVKEAIANNEKGKAPKRVVEASPSAYEAPAVVASMAAPKSVRRADFGQVKATRKPKDIE